MKRGDWVVPRGKRESREEPTGGGRLCEDDGTLPRTLTSKNYYGCLCECFLYGNLRKG